MSKFFSTLKHLPPVRVFSTVLFIL
jgi:hypothetical protein